MTVFYADLSHHDWNRVKGEFGWASIRAATSPVAVIRATYGDPSGWRLPTYHFQEMAARARAAGFTLLGGYHNLVTGDAASMRRQVGWLRSQLDAVPGGAEWAMADVERYPELMTSGMYPRWADVLRFQDAWYAVESRVMAWYLPQWVWSRSDMGHPDLSRLRGPLVASRYPTTVDGGPSTVYAAAGGDSGTGWAAYGGKAPAVWQFSSTVNVSGASGNTDVNAFRGTLAELTALLTGDDMTPAEFLTILSDPAVAAKMRGLAWGYQDAGDKSAHDIVLGEMRTNSKAAAEGVVALNAKVGAISAVDPAQVAAALAANADFVAALAAAVVSGVGDREAAADRARADVLDG